MNKCLELCLIGFSLSFISAIWVLIVIEILTFLGY
jgi:hypothetical protein